ncbi:MAG: long-chain-fatty-acid--CoA ligase [Epsilonproteobacteria bacterium]|nr:MAG: long-chain-fatty-acid--CoA ligase [Campylobacterota bacterium]RLA66460.1 MAG: long-chain-fatty-acid--CoA ligase [Campylobacterota bacterium]
MNRPWLSAYPAGTPEEIVLGEFNSIPELMENTFNSFRNDPAFSNFGKTLSFDEIDIMSQNFAGYLQGTLGLKKGERVAIMLPNILQYPIALFGILRAGLVAVNVNPLYTARELEHQLNDSEAKAILIFENSAHTLEKVLGNTKVEHVITTKVGDMLGFPKSAVINFVLKYVKKMVPDWNIPSAISFKSVMNGNWTKDYAKPEITLEDTAFLQYTGGTTGVSKGAILSHRNIVANLTQAKAWLGERVCRPGHIVITPLPLYHIFSLTANLFALSSIGGLNVLITNPRDIPNFVKELKKWKFTVITGVNTLFNALLAHKDFKDIDFSHLEVTLGGGMAVQRDTATRWKQVTKCTLIEAYGLTETSPAACMNPMNLPEYNGKIGLPISSTIVTIKDDSGADLPAGEVGEICIKGPQVMQGYWNRAEETALAFTEDDFFRTGDVGVMDEQGYFKIVDRKKDMILVSGFNVFPNEIEAVLCGHPKIFECAVVGIADSKSGEAVKAFIVRNDESLTKDEVIAFSRENMTRYKCPKFVEFRKDLPKSPVGKILRKDLRS